MNVDRSAVLVLRVFLVLLFGVLVVFQTLSLPGQFRHMAEENPHDADLRWPATIVAAFLVLCVQVVVVAIWKLLSMVQEDRIFSEASFTAVVRSAIIAGSPVTWTSVLGGASRSSTTERSHFTSSSEAGDPTADLSPTTR